MRRLLVVTVSRLRPMVQNFRNNNLVKLVIQKRWTSAAEIGFCSVDKVCTQNCYTSYAYVHVQCPRSCRHAVTSWEEILGLEETCGIWDEIVKISSI